jgi:hypothetical protein
MSEVQSVRFVSFFGFILQTAYTVGACALTILLPSLSLTDIFCAGHKSDASVGSGRRRRFLGLYGFGFSTTLWNVFVRELRDSVMFSRL